MIRSLRVFFAVGVMALPLGLGTAARAQTCPVLDVTCTVDQIVDTGGDTVDDVVGSSGDAVDNTVDDAQTKAHDAVDTVTGTAGDTVSTVRDTIDDTLGNVDNPLPGDGGGSGGGGGGGNGSGHDPNGNHNGVGSGGGRGGGHVGGSTGIPTATNASTPGAFTAPPGSLTTDQDRDPRSTIARVTPAVVGGIAVMALLLGAVALFLTVQDRMDRRDPKLLPASIGSDRVQFT
jgi:hypothetical protein